MRNMKVIAAIAAYLLTALPLMAQDDVMRFAAPRRLEAGDGFVGAHRLYASPTVHDVDGDGLLDVVVGDLRGAVTIAHGRRSDAGVSFAAEVAWNGQDGKPLDFENW